VSDRSNKLEPILQDAPTLTCSVAASGGGRATDPVPVAQSSQPSISQRLQALSERAKDHVPGTTCHQKLSINIFFDGTGNNLKADKPTLEHSNVARLFRAMPLDDETQGIFSRYVPGIGTLFPDIGDDGKGMILDTHNGMGAMGQARLDWALSEVKKIIACAEARAQNPTNKIVIISLSVFGFSRGAALARAFLRDLLRADGGSCEVAGSRLRWKNGKHPFEIRFVGLWDTVASVGAAMSANNMTAIRSSRRNGTNVLRRTLTTPPPIRAVDLAFGSPGADPAPGFSSGHSAWGDGLEIPGQWIAGQCVHLIAGHEQRNSFPVDSVLRGRVRPANTKEFVYPGMHSDVGGGYRPGEGGKGKAAPMDSLNPDAPENLGRITLRAMYDEALMAGVPLRRMNSNAWKEENAEDFDVSPTLIDRFNHYMAEVKTGSLPLGDAVLAHMRKLFEWKFRHILRNARAEHVRQVQTNEKVWQADKVVLEARKQSLGARLKQLQVERDRLRVQATSTAALQERAMLGDPKLVDPKTLLLTKAGEAQVVSSPMRMRMASIDAEIASIELQIKELQGREDTLPSLGTLGKNLSDFDAELVDDARSILAAIDARPALRQQLRPHYRHLVEAYEAELAGRGLTDTKIIAFFDEHIHDSLADFNQDCTLPSDPRVVFIGGSEKLRYAQSDALEAARASA